MHDENWPAPTPREQMLARVAARGNRIRAVRGAVNALVVMSVVGASALGVGTMIDGLGEGGAREVDHIAMVPDVPDAVTGSPADSSTTSGSSGGSAPGGGGSTGSEVASPTSGADGPATTGGPDTSGPSSGTATSSPGSGDRPSTSAPASTGSTTTSAPATTTTTEVVAPRVSNVRMKVDGDVPTDLMLCDDPSAVLAVDIEGAESAKVTWNRDGESSSTEMVAGESEWSAPVPQIDEKTADAPVVATIEAVGPGGGVTKTSVTIPVADCTPLPSASSVQRS